MKATHLLNYRVQSLWLDNITLDLLDSGTLKSYVDERSVTGLTSNPTIFDHAIKNSSTYDAAICQKSGLPLHYAASPQACYVGLIPSAGERYVGSSGHIIGIKTFGASAPVKELQRKVGFAPDRLVAAAKELPSRG